MVYPYNAVLCNCKIKKKRNEEVVYLLHEKSKGKTVCIMCYLLHTILKSGKHKNIKFKFLEYIYRMSERTIKHLIVAAENWVRKVDTTG